MKGKFCAQLNRRLPSLLRKVSFLPVVFFFRNNCYDFSRGYDIHECIRSLDLATQWRTFTSPLYIPFRIPMSRVSGSYLPDTMFQVSTLVVIFQPSASSRQFDLRRSLPFQYNADTRLVEAIGVETLRGFLFQKSAVCCAVTSVFSHLSSQRLTLLPSLSVFRVITSGQLTV